MNSLLILPLADVPVTQWDPPGIIIFKLAVIAALVGLNGFFVACEFAIIKVRASQLDELAEEGNPRARFAKYIRAHLDAYLSATQLGVTVASLALGWLGEEFLAHPQLLRRGLPARDSAADSQDADRSRERFLGSQTRGRPS